MGIKDILKELEEELPNLIDKTAPKIIKWVFAWYLIKLGIALIILGLGAIAALLITQNLVASLPKPCLLYTSPSPRDLSTSRMPSSA